MPHRLRHDEPGSRHHLINRGVSHRVLVGGDADASRFLDFAAEYFDRHGVRILAFAILQTHFHLFVQSDRGGLGDAMRCLESRYDRRFNLKNGRSGALVGSRYWSNRVLTLAYFRALIAYIDQNPVEAGLVAMAIAYPFSSRRYYGRASGPSWLYRSPIEEFVRTSAGKAAYDPDDYDRVFGLQMSGGRARWFSAFLRSRDDDLPMLDELIKGTPTHVREWMNRCARNADGDAPAIRVVDSESILLAVDSLKSCGAARVVRSSRRARPTWTLLRPGLLRQLAMLTWAEIAGTLGISVSEARSRCADHLKLLQSDADYAELAALGAHDAIRRCHG